MALFEGNLLTHRHEIRSQKSGVSISPGLGALDRYRDVTDTRTDRQTDRRTDRITIASTTDEAKPQAKKSECLKSDHDVSMTSDDDGEDMCANCRKSVPPSHKALQRNGCGLWHHTNCTDRNDEDYISALRGCCARKFLHTVENGKGWLTHRKRGSANNFLR